MAVVYHFRDMITAMREKDAELYESIKNLVPSRAIAIWRQKYPEDFAAHG